MPFVDLFTPDAQRLLRVLKAQAPLTINGVHLNEARRQPWSPRSIDERSVREPCSSRTIDREGSNRSARPSTTRTSTGSTATASTDGYSTYGDRAFLKFRGRVRRRLRTTRSCSASWKCSTCMTANRDKVDLGRRAGQDDQARRRQPAAVHPGHHATSPARCRAASTCSSAARRRSSKMTRRQGAEGQPVRRRGGCFPSWSTRCRWRSTPRAGCGSPPGRRYPHWKPTEPMNDKLLILEDTNGDGRADKCNDVRRRPAQPDRLRVLERRRARRAGARTCCSSRTPTATTRPTCSERVLHGLDTADTHHTANSFTLDPGGALYFQEGTFHHTQVETPWGPPRARGQRRRLPLRAAGAEVRRLRLVRLRQPARPRLRPLGAGHRRRRHRRRTRITARSSPATSTIPHKHARPPQVYQQRTRPCPGIEYPLQPALSRTRCRATCSCRT